LVSWYFSFESRSGVESGYEKIAKGRRGRSLRVFGSLRGLVLSRPVHPVPSQAHQERGTMEFSILYQELQQSTEMVRALLAGVAPEAARLKPSTESWSILEVVCHLYDEEREDFREHLDFILHRQQEEWHLIDTEGWVTQRNYNEQNFAEMKAQGITQSRLGENLYNCVPHYQRGRDVRLLGRARQSSHPPIGGTQAPEARKYHKALQSRVCRGLVTKETQIVCPAIAVRL
jgi:hypothetical protein